MPLTQEQFQKARSAGFSTEQIIGFEKKRESNIQPSAGSELYGERVIPQITKALYEGLPFGKRVISMMPNAEQLKANLESTPEPKNLQAKIGQGIGSALPTIAMASPAIKAASMIPVLGRSAIASGAIGFGGYEGAKAGLQGKSIVPATLQGILSGATYGVGGRLGTQTLSKIAPNLKYGANIGTGLGQAGAGALMAPEGDKLSSAIVGGGLGVLAPIKARTSSDIINKNTKVYRNVLNPTKTEINNLEIKSGKNIDDFYKLAAQEKLIVKRSSDNKIDTEDAILQLKPNKDILQDNLNQSIASQPQKQFDLNGIGWYAKQQLGKNIKNATELKQAYKQVDEQIANEIELNGNSPFVDGTTLNNIKKGMWSVSYNPLAPNENRVPRNIGYAIKDIIEKSYPEQNIQKLNEQLGQYHTLETLLKNAHGKPVKGNFMSRFTGQVIGGIAGSKVPVLGTPIGAYAGGKVSDFMNNPERITKSASNKLPAIGAGLVAGSLLAGGQAQAGDLPKFNESAHKDQLNPKIINKIKLLKQKADAAGIEFRVSQGYRSPKEQEALYAQGRTKPGKIVTKLKHGRHNEGLAFDVAIIKNGKMSTDEKDYDALGKLGREIGLEWGGDWKSFQDRPHFQLSKKNNIPDDKAIKTIIGEAESEGLDSMRAHAAAIRNRGTLDGAYGLKSPRVLGKLYSKEIYEQAKQAWEESQNKDYSDGANHWFSDADLKKEKVQKMIKEGNMKLVKKIKGTSFYKE